MRNSIVAAGEKAMLQSVIVIGILWCYGGSHSIVAYLPFHCELSNATASVAPPILVYTEDNKF